MWRYRYTYTEYGANVWHGSVLLVVTNSRDRPPTLYLKPEHFPDHAKHVTGTVIHLDDNPSGPKTFWRFSLDVPLSNSDQRVDYQIKLFEQDVRCCNASFYVPGKDESMRILFHSCNGFSLAVKQEDYAGSLWKDVLRSEFVCVPVWLSHEPSMALAALACNDLTEGEIGHDFFAPISSSPCFNSNSRRTS
jgi:hypothetical protein